MPIKLSKFSPKLKSKKVYSLAFALVLIVLGAYGLVLTVSPSLPVIKADPFTQNQVEAIEKTGDKIIIPKVGVNISFASGGQETLEKGAWWRYPERGNPVDGGNFILSAHRFSLGLTPGQTRTKSPFYNIDKLNIGDEIIIDYKDKRYEYSITDKFRVSPDRIDIESASQDAKLTLYSCTLKGAQDGREVLIAKLMQ